MNVKTIAKIILPQSALNVGRNYHRRLKTNFDKQRSRFIETAHFWGLKKSDRADLIRLSNAHAGIDFEASSPSIKRINEALTKKTPLLNVDKTDWLSISVLIGIWSKSPEKLTNALQLLECVGIEQIDKYRSSRFTFVINQAVNTGLKARDFASVDKLIQYTPLRTRERLRKVYWERIEREIYRTCFIDKSYDTLAWVEEYSHPPFADLISDIRSFSTTKDTSYLESIPIESLMELACNSPNQRANLEGAYMVLLDYLSEYWSKFISPFDDSQSTSHSKAFQNSGFFGLQSRMLLRKDRLEYRQRRAQERQRRLKEREQRLAARKERLRWRQERMLAKYRRQRAQIERQKLRALTVNREYLKALDIASALCKSPEANVDDLYKRVALLNRLGRTEIVNRYVQNIHWAIQKGRISKTEGARKLMAAWRPQSGLNALGDTVAWRDNVQATEIALTCYYRMRQFKEAASLLEYLDKNHSFKKNMLPTRLIERHETAIGYLEQNGLMDYESSDATHDILKHWVETVQYHPLPKFDSVSKRVLVYSHSLGIGGAERQVTNLIKGLTELADVESVHLLLKERARTAYAMEGSSDKFEIRDFSDLPEKLPEPWNSNEFIVSISEVIQHIGFASLLPILKAIYEIRPEVIHVRGGLHAEVLIGAILAGVPRVVVHFGSMTRKHQSSGTELELLRESLVEKTMKVCVDFDSVVLAANSRAAADDWAISSDIAPEKVSVIYNAIDKNELGFSNLPPFDQKSFQQPVVGGVFRLSPVKDPLLWVEVANLVHKKRNDIKFLIVGDGPMRSAVEKAIRDYNLEEHFELAGIVREGMFEKLSQMSLSLLTTKTESLPNTVIEAQLAGLPVVAPDVGGVSEAIANTESAILTSRDAQELADAVLKFLADEKTCEKIYKTAPARIAEKFSKKSQMEQTIRAYGW